MYIETLKEEILKLIVNDFGGGLTNNEYNQYVTKLKRYFVDYLVTTKLHCNTIEELFKHEFTRKDVIDSTKYYIIENPNVKKESAIDDFLISLNRLFDETLNKKYFNQNLVNIQPFTNLSKEIEIDIKSEGLKKLEKRESFPSVSKSEYDFIIEYFNNYKIKTITHYQYKIIVDLLLLYGFSYNKIVNLKISDYSKEKGTLSVMYGDNDNGRINLELPYKLYNMMNAFLEVRILSKYESKSMFITKEGTDLTNAYLTNILKEIKNKLYDDIPNRALSKSRNTFTPTGLAKYGVIQMILQGMNQSIILDLTGFKEEQYTDCQNVVNDTKNLDRNRYVNHIIRGISTYDDI